MSEILDIKLLDKNYRLSCAEGERESLLAAVALLESRLGDFGKLAKGGGERAAVMAALDFAHELVMQRQAAAAADTPASGALESASITGRINSIEARITAALEQP